MSYLNPIFILIWIYITAQVKITGSILEYYQFSAVHMLNEDTTLHNKVPVVGKIMLSSRCKELFEFELTQRDNCFKKKHI